MKHVLKLLIPYHDFACDEQMKYVIVYWSRYGNGKMLVTRLVETLKKKGAETELFTTDEVDPAAMSTADIYIFSAPAESFNLQENMRNFLEHIQGLEGKKYGIINTHWMRKNKLAVMEKNPATKRTVKATYKYGLEKSIKQGMTYRKAGKRNWKSLQQH